MNNINTKGVDLLSFNKQNQVNTLIELGFSQVTMDTPASQIADYIRWVGGLLDLSIATISLETKKHVFFTSAEWSSMSANNRAKYVRIGLRIRAERKQFIIGKSDCTAVDGGRTFKWGAYGTDVKGVKNYGPGNQGLYDCFTGKEDTDTIIDVTAELMDNAGVVGAPAASAAKSYKACTLDADGVEDVTEWYLPSQGQLIIIAKYKQQINTLLTSVYGSTNNLTSDWYWSSTEYNASSAWYVSMYSGCVNTNNKSTAGRVRPVSAIDSLSL